jgi:transposase
VVIQGCFLEAALEGEVLRDDQWARIEPFVPGGRKGKRGPRSNGRLFIDALLWMARSGARWRDLPEKFGPYERAKQRYYRWIRMGVLDTVFEAVAAEPDLEWVMLDATVIRAHAQAAGARRKRGDRTPRRLAARAAVSEPSSTSA